MTPPEYINMLKDSLVSLECSKIDLLITLIKETQKNNKTVYVFGNGGSGANASHFVQDLLKCPVKDYNSNKGRYKAVCLNDNTPVIMAYANDINYEVVFKQQLMNFCEERDLVIGISGSGNSANVVKAFEYADRVKAVTFSIVGFDGGKLLPIAQKSLHIKTNNMQLYEDMAMMSLHAVVSALKE